MSKSVRRLYSQFVPENYQLEISVNPEAMTFSGTVTIAGKKTGRPSRRITFHQKKLKITNASIVKHSKADQEKIKVARINKHDSYNEVRLHTSEMLFPGSYTVSISFEGKVTKNMTGLYPCYFEHDGTTNVMFATQFESHHAREVFPCIDEPEAKATFDLTLYTPSEQEVLANTPIKVQNQGKNNVQTTFETTPVMSVYLLAFVFGKLHSIEKKTKNGIVVRSWATIAQPKENLEFSANEAVKILDYYEEYFGTPFPLTKCDQVALPDFESGAMENWGLITYREVALLTDPGNPSLSTEQYVAMVIAHELSHQWFGNLVTMKWWDDLWLNESFASLMEHIALDAMHPDWHQWEHYASQDVIAASNRDIYNDVQSVGTGVMHPDEISTLFDPAIVYAKGGRLLKMMREYIGDEAFRTALKKYFKAHAYKNTSRDDLWEAMSEASGKDVKALMTPWLVQSGMPVVKIEAGPSKNKRTLSQSRFVLDSNADGQLWPIPLLASEPVSPDMLSARSDTISFDELPVFNSNGSGHFLVNYALAEDLSLIIEHAGNDDITAEARMTLLNDLMLLARRGDISLVDSLHVVQSLENEQRDAVWSIMARALGLAATLGEYDDIIEAGLKRLRYNLALKHYEKLGWDDVKGEDPNTTFLRSTMASLMLGSENQEIIDFVLNLYDKTPMDKIPSDRRSHVFGTVMKHRNKTEDYDTFVNIYKTSHDPDMQLSLSAALASTKSKEVAKKLIKDALSDSGFVRNQDYFRWFAYLMRNKHTRELAWDWLQDSWSRLYAEFGGGKSLEYFVNFSSAPIQTPEWESKFLSFFEPKETDIALARNIAIAKSEIRARVKWRERDLKNLQAFFKSVQ